MTVLQEWDGEGTFPFHFRISYFVFFVKNVVYSSII